MEIYAFSRWRLRRALLAMPKNRRGRGSLREALGWDEMTKLGDLSVHAQRCEDLAELCTDGTIALKLRALAAEYRGMAKGSMILTPVLFMKECPLCGISHSIGADEAF